MIHQSPSDSPTITRAQPAPSLMWRAKRAFRLWAHRRSVAGLRDAHGGDFGGWGLAIVRDACHPGWMVHVFPPQDKRRPLTPADARRMAEAMLDAATKAETYDRVEVST